MWNMVQQALGGSVLCVCGWNGEILMTENIDGGRMSERDQVIEYGRHLFGVFPWRGEQNVTGVIHFDGGYFESYVGTGNWSQYPNWVREYTETPLGSALEAYVEGREMESDGVVLESAGMSGWRFEYQRKRAFRRAVLTGSVDLGTVAIINRYGEVYCPPDDAESVREQYWEYVDRHYEHRHSHYSVTKTQSVED